MLFSDRVVPRFGQRGNDHLREIGFRDCVQTRNGKIVNLYLFIYPSIYHSIRLSIYLLCKTTRGIIGLAECKQKVSSGEVIPARDRAWNKFSNFILFAWRTPFPFVLIHLSFPYASNSFPSFLFLFLRTRQNKDNPSPFFWTPFSIPFSIRVDLPIYPFADVSGNGNSNARPFFFFFFLAMPCAGGPYLLLLKRYLNKSRVFIVYIAITTSHYYS